MNSYNDDERRFRLRAMAFTSAIAALVAQPVYGQFRIEKIALTRDSAPETDLVFDEFESPVLNSQGEVSFNATVTGSDVTLNNNDTIYTGSSEGSLSLVARRQTELDGFGAGVSPSFFGVPVTNASGQMVFAGEVAGPGINGTNDRIAFLRKGGVLQPLSRAGDSAPVAEPDATFAGTANSAFN